MPAQNFLKNHLNKPLFSNKASCSSVDQLDELPQMNDSFYILYTVYCILYTTSYNKISTKKIHKSSIKNEFQTTY